MNIANFINVYTNIYTFIVCDENDSKKIDSINSILQHGRVVDKNCCVVFPTSGFSYLALCPRQWKWKLAITYLGLRAIEMFEYENLMLLKPPEITRKLINEKK